MRTASYGVALALLAGLTTGASAQSGAGGATVPQPERPQSTPNLNHDPRPSATSGGEYVQMLDTSLSQLREAIRRTQGEPAGNVQKAMTPARMDVKAAAQHAYDVIRRAPEDIRSRDSYRDSERQVRENLARLSQPTRLEDSNGAAEAVLATLEKLRQSVAQGAGTSRPG
jgi:hypothetical protein